MFVRFTNAVLLSLIGLLTLSGLWGIAFNLTGWMFDLHRAAGWAVLALAPFKFVIAKRSLARGLRPRLSRNLLVLVSLVLAALTLLVLAFGVLWAWQIGPELYWLGGYADTAISWHWMLALVLLAPLAVHVWRRWPRPRHSDFVTRRAAFKLVGLGAAGAVGWWMAQGVAGRRASAAAPRRFTGSIEQRSFSGNDMPITHSAGEGAILLNPSTWTLTLSLAAGRSERLTYMDLLALPSTEQVATLDCTTGWYSTQTWRGVPLVPLLERAGLGDANLIKLRGATGYFGDFTLDEARQILLATHVGGQILNHWHGFPLRVVAPTRRGWFWIKWLTHVDAVRIA